MWELLSYNNNTIKLYIVDSKESLGTKLVNINYLPP